MKISVLTVLILITGILSYGQPSALKSVIYDFDGLNIGDTDLPDGDYRNDDLSYKVVATPLVNSEVLGDRVLELDVNWQTGKGEFGKDISRFIDLNAATDRLNFYLYNPPSNGADSILQLFITEDDNSNNVYEYANDDKWTKTISIHRSANWQLISVPLSSFADENFGGNGIFDVGYGGTGSRFFSIGFIFNRTATVASETYFIDMINFSEGTFPTGASILDLPAKSNTGHCLLGALANNDFPDSTPDTVNRLFPEHKLTYVNWFLDYAATGTIANAYPGDEVQHLLDGGYVPVITWEMMYEAYPRLDPVQPRLSQLLNGSFDAYIDAFADKIRSYNQLIILRIFHEFEGNWYSWSLTENGSDPGTYIAAYRHVVDRFRARGVDNVKWMWCVNAEPKPYLDYNWIVDAYPGDNYVDIVATDIYNHPDLGVPAWKSFRYTVAETYYYLTKYFPSKPFYICEVASRERYSSEPASSQSKAEWICRMKNDLQSYFSQVRALIFFSTIKEHDWRMNSSQATLDAIRTCIWNDDYFGRSLAAGNPGEGVSFNAYPNPFTGELNFIVNDLPANNYTITLFNLQGEKVAGWNNVESNTIITAGGSLASGIYIVELKGAAFSEKIKVVKLKE